MKLALQLYTVNQQVCSDFAGTIGMIAEIGYDGVELSGYCGKKPEEIKAILNDHQLGVAGSILGIHSILQEPEKTVEKTLALGSPFLICPAVPAEYRTDLAALRELIDGFQRIGEVCRRCGIQFLHHVHGQEFLTIGNETILEIILREVDSELLGLQVDVYWVRRSDVDEISFLQAYRDRLRSLHLKDMANTENCIDTEVGAGLIDIRGAMEIGYEAKLPWMVVEQEAFPNMSAMESIADSLGNIRRIEVDLKGQER